MNINFSLGDSKTGAPFKVRRTSKKAEREDLSSLLSNFFRRLGWKPKGTDNYMKEVRMLVPAIAGGKPRQKGDKLTLTDLKAAELVSMKIVEIVGEIPNPKVQPWEKPRPKAKPAAA